MSAAVEEEEGEQEEVMTKRNKSAGFLDANLELLGFGNEKDALIQAVKELFENGRLFLPEYYFD